MLASCLVYAGLLALFLGSISLVKPLRFLRIRGRPSAALVLVLSAFLAGAGFAVPTKEVRVEVPRTHLDEFVPVYQFNEVHSIRIQAPRERVYQAVKAVTADEIFLLRTLTWLRRFGRPGPESVLNAPERLPILDVATRTTFRLLAEEVGREIVVGTVVLAPPGFRVREKPTAEEFKALHEPGFALAAMNFIVEDAGPDACRVTTETRVYATDASARRKFARYWRVIYPGSALLRHTWLRAIRHRAESGGN